MHTWNCPLTVLDSPCCLFAAVLARAVKLYGPSVDSISLYRGRRRIYHCRSGNESRKNIQSIKKRYTLLPVVVCGRFEFRVATYCSTHKSRRSLPVLGASLSPLSPSSPSTPRHSHRPRPPLPQLLLQVSYGRQSRP